MEHRRGHQNVHGCPCQTVGGVIHILLFPNTQDLEGMTFSTVKNFNLLLLVYPVLDCWTILFLYVHLQDTKGVISETEVLKKEPVSDVIALKDSLKYFDADFFNDSKVNLNR